ncbi:MAG: phage Gp37/Gp68 family protein [Pseudomonadota bacterium]
MSGNTWIEYCDATWNVTTGCTPDYACWQRCWARRMARRFGDKEFKPTCHPERLEEPLRWRKPRRVAVSFMGDLFNDAIPDEFIDQVFAVMALCPQHTFLVLTKRAERMREYLSQRYMPGRIADAAILHNIGQLRQNQPWPLSNAWLGVSVSTQVDADERIPPLLATPAAVRFVSVEPMLGPVDLTHVRFDRYTVMNVLEGVVTTKTSWTQSIPNAYCEKVSWTIVGGESGPGARPLHPDWVRGLRDQAKAAGVKFYFKGWGEWVEDTETAICRVCGCTDLEDCPNGCYWVEDPEGLGDLCSNCVGKPAPAERPILYDRVGRKAAGRLLDGREWNEMPEGRPQT